MPNVTATPKGQLNGEVVTEFTDVTSTSSVTFTYPVQQSGIMIENSGVSTIYVTVGVYTNQVVQPDKKWKVDASFISFSIRSDINSQEFTATAYQNDVEGSGIADHVGRSMAQSEFDKRGINAQKNGAIGNGQVVDRVPVQTTMDDAGNGGVVFIPPGQYLADGFLNVNKNVILTGNNAEIKRDLAGSGRYFNPLNYAKVDLDGVNPNYLTPHNAVQWDLYDYHSVDYKTANKKDHNIIDDFINSIKADKVLTYFNSATNHYMYVVTKNRNKVNWYSFAVLNAAGDFDTGPTSVGGTSTRMRNNKLYTNLKMYACEKILDARITVAAGTVQADTVVPTTFYPGSFQFTTGFNFRTINPTTTFTYTSPNRVKNLAVITGTGGSTNCSIKVDGISIGTFNFKVATAPEEGVRIVTFPFEGKVIEVTHTDGFTRFLGFSMITEKDSLNTPAVEQFVVYGDPIVPYIDKPEINYALLIGSPTGTNFKWAGGYHGGEVRQNINVYTDQNGTITNALELQWQVVDAIYVDQTTRLTHPSYTGDVVEAKSLIKMDYMGYGHDVNFNALQTITMNRAAVGMSSNTIDVTNMLYVPNYGVIDLSANISGTDYIRENAILKFNKDFTKPLTIANILIDGNFSHYNYKYVDQYNQVILQSGTPSILKTYLWWICKGDGAKYETIPAGYKRTFRQRHIMQDYRMPVF